MTQHIHELPRPAAKRLFGEITDVPEVFQGSYFPSLDGLRALSILTVVVSHVLMAYKFNFDLQTPANAGVQFFFTISGFLITTLLIKEKIKTGHISLKKFYIRRFFRIIPVSYLYLLLIVIANYMFKLHLHWYFILASFFFARNFFMGASGPDHLTTHYWSLSFEEQFYFLFPVILKKNIKVYTWFLISIILFSVFIDVWGVQVNSLLGDNIFSKNFIWFFTGLKSISVGSILSILVFKKILKINFKYKTLTTAILFVLIGLIISLGRFIPNLSVIIVAFIFGCIMVDNLRQSSSLVFKFLNSGTMKLIGILSYSLYIWQQPFTLNLTYLNSSHFLRNIDNKLSIDIIISVVCLVVLAVISYLSYFFFEKKFLLIKQKFK